MVSERPARSGKSPHGAPELEITDFEMNLIRNLMVSERPAKSRKHAPEALEPYRDHIDCAVGGPPRSMAGQPGCWLAGVPLGCASSEDSRPADQGAGCPASSGPVELKN